MVIFGRDLDLYQHEPVYFGGAEGLSLEAIQINDSRCPEGVTCIWQGYASVTIKVKSGHIPITELILCLGACNVTSTTAEQVVKINNESYTIRLKQIEKGKREGLKAVVSLSRLLD